MSNAGLLKVVRQEEAFRRLATLKGLIEGTPQFDDFIEDCFEAERSYQRMVTEVTANAGRIEVRS